MGGVGHDFDLLVPRCGRPHAQNDGGQLIEGSVTQAKLAEEVGTSAPYVSRLIRNNEKIVNKTFLQLMEKLGYDVELNYVEREE